MTTEPKIDCLDHGFVRLVDHMGNDLSVVRAARVSYDAAWRAGENEKSDKKLINYLWKHKHTTPFEAVTFTFEVKAPIFVFRQWHRHRTWSYNELSARYRELPEEFYVPDPTKLGKPSAIDKQSRNFVDGEWEPGAAKVTTDLMHYHCCKAFEEYKYLLEQGVPKELARIVLPLATYSHMFGTTNLLNLMKFFTLRSDAHAQYEIRVYSEAMTKLAKVIVPVCIEAWESNQ